MSASQHPIFRENAIKAYVRGRDKDILPRFIAPPTFLFIWILLLLFLFIGGLVWNIRLPTYLSGTGFVVAGTQPTQVQAVVFFSPDQLSQLHVSQSIQIHIGQNGPTIQSSVTTVESVPLSPEQAYQRFQLDSAAAALITGPSVALLIALDNSAIPPTLYTGSLVQAQVEIGTHSVLSLIPGLQSLAGD